jgi:formylglycine-generating enzyme required for sulfatase activity
MTLSFICNFFFLFGVSQSAQDSFALYFQNMPSSSLRFKMVPIKGGSFIMGSSEQEKGHQPDESPQRAVTISPFWMGAFEVSRDEFDVFYKDDSTSQNSELDAVTRPSAQYIDLTWGVGKSGGYPVNSMSQYAALMYCRWLYAKTGIFYRLPTEAEWEYACRAGSTTAYYFGDDPKDLDKYAWYSRNSKNKYQQSGQKLPNAWGLYDMLGNVSEWTLDHYDEKALEKIADKSTDPSTGPNSAKYPKVLKGGSFTDDAQHLRNATRIKSDRSWNRRDPQIPKSKWWLTDASNVGFRIIRPLKQPTREEAENFYKEYLGN